MRAAPSSFFLLFAAACSAAEPSPPGSSLAQAPAAAGDDAGAPDASDPMDDAQAPADRRSAGCGKAPPIAPGGIAPSTLTAAGKTRSFHVSAPSGYDRARAYPIVFVHHGAGDDAPETQRDWFVDEAAAPAVYVYPQALPRTRKDGSGGSIPRWDVDGDEDLRFFDAMLEELSNEWCIDRARVFASGFSSGGNFAQQLGCLRSEALRAFATVAGPGPFTTKCGGKVGIWMTHDTDDDALPVSGARGSRDFWAEHNACGASWTKDPALPAECKTNAGCPAAAPTVYCESSGVGHDVPAFASKAIARFFSSFDGGGKAR